MAAVALTGACDSSEPTASSAPEPRTSPSSTAPASDGKDAKTILDQAFSGREALGSGYGRLQPQLGNTVPAVPENVLSVTFAFTCTGKGKAVINFTVNGRYVPSVRHTSTCDGSIFQQSVQVSAPRSGPGPISFNADVTGSDNGGFAYAYYAEKKTAANK
ncbi:hypothetical protein [Streptomyces guryensis]|uniref:Uncharacterized protein n=1 Tax=Streptomyces guryensis TaxID=2886947 RepID=A0A9Q3ZDB4_9ACTN|nr:hypothetical protein [Streptomyces guryensis]MCD9880527.1 hypothetical protein [Streptomyces guryensis]